MISSFRRGAGHVRRGLIAFAALALGSIPAVAVVSQAHAASGCNVTYTVANQWATGFTVQGITITNLGSPLTSWTLQFSFPGSQTIASNPWNGTFTQSGQMVTITNLSYNGSVATNANVNPGPGFNGVLPSGAANPSPTTFTLNGTVCNGGPTPTPTPTPTGTPTPTPTPTGTPTPTPTPSRTPTPTP